MTTSLLSDRIREQADTIEALSGERPVGIRLTKEQVLQLYTELNHGRCPDKLPKSVTVHGLKIEVIDD